eukprot:COSAG01_NODE_1163_length_11454_cov_3.546808_10_plen_92_part_00
MWNATQDLQSATIQVSTMAAGGLNISTSSFIGAGTNVLITSLNVSQDTTLSFTLKFPVGEEGHTTRADVGGGQQMPYVVGETTFRSRNFAR